MQETDQNKQQKVLFCNSGGFPVALTTSHLLLPSCVQGMNGIPHSGINQRLVKMFSSEYLIYCFDFCSK